jgi:hypothetical protein
MVDFEKPTKTSGNTTKVYKEESLTKSKSKFSMVFPKVSANVQTVLNTMREDPDLLKDLNKALTVIFAAANVDLTVEEKKEFLGQIADTITSTGKGVHV